MDQNRKGVIIQSSHDRNLDVIRAIHDPSSLEKAHELLEQVDCEDIQEAKTSFYDQFDSKQLAALGRKIQSERQPCFALDALGRVLAANAQADTLLGARPGRALRDLEVCDVGKMAIGAQLKDLFLRPKSVQKPCVLQIQASRLMRGYTIVLKPPSFEEGVQSHVVAHLVEGTHTPSFEQHITEVYHLTSSESAVLSQFMSGQTLEQIAVSRRRSAATVKKQFYGLMSKFKVKSQAELLQHVMTLSIIYDVPDPTQKPSAHPCRQETKVLRPHGRVVEVVLAGDLLGTPVLMVPTLFQRCFPAQVEQHLKGAGILMITVVPPGRGKTSRSHQGTSDRACFVDDIVAVLDQLSIDRAILFGTDDILRLAVLLAKEIPDRLAHVLVTAPVLPISYEKASRHRDNFIPSSKKFQLLKPAMKTLSLALFWQSLTILHAKGMIRLFLRNDPADLMICLEPDTLREIGAAFDSVISVGFETGAKHHLSTFDDWETHIETCPIPITIYEGTKSRLCDRAALRRFADDFREVIKLVEIETTGTSFPYVRPDLMIEMLLACQVRSETCG